MLYMGIDIGTTHIKALLIDEKCKQINLVLANHTLVKDCTGQNVIEPLSLWNNIVDCIKRCLKGSDPKGVKAITISSMAETGVPLNKDGDELYNFILWNDTRNLDVLDKIQNHMEPYDIYKKTGLILHCKHPLTRLYWLKEHDPYVLTNTASWLSVADYIVYKLTGEKATDYSLASRTMLYNISENKWDKSLIDLCGISNIFPEVHEIGTPVGRVQKSMQEELGLTEAVVVLGGHDHLSASVLAELKTEHEIFNSMGTSEVLLGFSEKLELNEKSFQYGFNQGLLNVNTPYWMASISSSGASIEWLRNFISHSDKVTYEVFDLIKECQNDIIYFPYLNGKGTPCIDPKGKGSFVHIGYNDGLTQFLNATYEGISFQIKYVLDALKEAKGIEVQEIFAVGGSTKNHLWMQIKRDILKTNLHILDICEAAAFGSCLIAARGVGDNLNYTVKYQDTLARENGWKDYYEKKYEKFLRLSEIL